MDGFGLDKETRVRLPNKRHVHWRRNEPLQRAKSWDEVRVA